MLRIDLAASLLQRGRAIYKGKNDSGRADGEAETATGKEDGAGPAGRHGNRLQENLGLLRLHPPVRHYGLHAEPCPGKHGAEGKDRGGKGCAVPGRGRTDQGGAKPPQRRDVP